MPITINYCACMALNPVFCLDGKELDVSPMWRHFWLLFFFLLITAASYLLKPPVVGRTQKTLSTRHTPDRPAGTEGSTEGGTMPPIPSSYFLYRTARRNNSCVKGATDLLSC